MPEVMRLLAPCKVNLILEVVGRRQDGYHELRTWMQKLDLCDELTLAVREGEGVSLTCSDPDLPADETNLAWRAAAAFFDVSVRGRGFGVDIALVKRIPSGAGLGGGSSDAGTVLRGLNGYFNNEFSEQELVRLATPLGADVPFFAVEHNAVWATGIGELMVPVPSLDHHHFLLVNPGFHVSTKWVFDTFALTSKQERSSIAPSRNQDVTALSLDDMRNDLELVTSGAFSEIGLMRQRLLEAGAYMAMMSGSGPTVFGVFPDDRAGLVAIQGAAEKLRLEYPENVFIARACAGAWPSG